MRTKIILIVLLIGLIVGLLALTPIGKNLTSGVNVVPGLSGLLTFGPQEYFQMQLVAKKDAFAGKPFELFNTSLHLNGVCIGSVYVFGANIAKEGRCDIKMDGVRGKLEYSTIDTIEATLEADQVTLDGIAILPANDKKVIFSVVPTELYISNYKSNLVSLPSVTGEVKRFKPEGTIDQVKTLTNEKVEISSYAGNVRLLSIDIVLSGVATKVNWFS